MENINTIHLVGIALKSKTTNENGQSNIDCGMLWQKFEQENVPGKIPSRSGEEIYAVYYNYEGNYLKPFSYFIGSPVEANTPVPDGLVSMIIPGGNYEKVTARGKMPECIAGAWKGIWESTIQRIYQVDFEVYDVRSRDWENAEVDIFLSV